MGTHTINKFSFNRIGSYTKDLLIGNKQSILWACIILFAIKVIPPILNEITANNTGFNFLAIFRKSNYSTFEISSKLIMLFAIIVMSMHFSKYKEGTFFERTFVLPVKMSEKFISMLLIYIILIPLFLYVTDIAATCIKYLIAHNGNSTLSLNFFGNNIDFFNKPFLSYSTSNTNTINNISNTSNNSINFTLISGLGYLLTLLFFFTGFIIYKRHSIIKTLLSIIGFSIGMLIIVAILGNFYQNNIQSLLTQDTFPSVLQDVSFYGAYIATLFNLLLVSLLIFIGWNKFNNYR